MNRATKWLGQAALWIALMAAIGHFSTQPRFSPVPPGQALVRVSFIHAAGLRRPCRERSAEELQKLPPNMRASMDCPRERADVLFELELDGQMTLRRTLPPSGLRHDGNAVLYERFTIPEGRHRVVARLRDRADGDFNHVAERSVELPAGRVLLIDFNAARGGFIFRD